MGPLKITFIIIGTLSLLLGLIGLIVPGLPTTPFLILTSILYLRSSDKLYGYLVSNKYIGTSIKSFHENKGMSMNLKVFSIAMMWIMISISFYFISSPVRYVLLFAGFAGTVIMGFIIPTITNKNKF